ncbi:MAG: zf-HC2 domain-containing protein [Microcoleus vaginatus WJT46-NPBG5]|jgi:anti-sigma factor RsiW|nr:zf-HC2 domain-containing protein [Microcoleus vaginatus WJT46-NPBG5]
MTPNFEFHDDSRKQPQGESLDGKLANHAELMGAVNTLKRDRFELLSAYLDGEVTAAERRQVEEWLANDPMVQRLHSRLLGLRQGLHKMPVPAAQQSVEETVEQVFARIDRRPKRAILWGGAALAAMFIAAVSGMMPSQQSFAPQIAQSPQTSVSDDSLMIALNNPVVEIPKAPVATPEKSVITRALIVE